MAERFAAVASRAQRLDGFAQTLEPVSTAGRYKVMQSALDNDVYASVDGGAWVKIIDPSGLVVTVSLNAAYQGGQTITVTDLLGAVTLAGTRVSGTLLSLTNTATASAAIVGASINLTGTTMSNIAATGLRIDMPTSTRANTALEGALVVNSLALGARALDIAVGNTTSTIAHIRYGTAATLVAAITGLSIDCSTNVTPGAFMVRGLLISAAATTRPSAVNEGVFMIASAATVMKVIECRVANTGAATGIVCVSYQSSATLTAAIVAGIALDLSASVTPGAFQITSFRTTVAATTRADTALEAAGLVVSSTATAMRMIDCAVANTSAATGLWCLRYGTSTSISAAVTGINVDLSTNVTPGAIAIRAILVTGAATTRADTAGEALIAVDNRATVARSLDWQVRNTSAATGLWCLRWGASTSVNASTTAVFIDMAANVTPNAAAFQAISIRVGGTTRANTANEGVILIDSGATRMRVIECLASNTGATGGIWSLRYATATTISSGLVGLNIDLSTNVDGNNNVLTGVQVTTDVNSGATSACFSAIPNAGAGILFASAAGTFHVLGPQTAGAALTLGAGTPSSGAGNSITLTASAAASGVTAGGGISLLEGAGTGGGARGTIAVGAATTAVLKFYNTGGAVQATVTGAKGGNAALGSLLTALAAIGLVVDGSGA